MNELHCPVIHGGLTLELKSNGKYRYRHCCLRDDQWSTNDIDFDFFNASDLKELRETNLQNRWDRDCSTCFLNEASGHKSFRTGMSESLNMNAGLSGPTRLDLQFDTGCNLACRTCGPHSSSFWAKHLRDNNLPAGPQYKSRVEEMLHILKRMDLSNLQLVVFCGGETLLGNAYWRVAEYLSEVRPNITLAFQTNGTQPIPERYYETIEKFDLVKLNISLDGIGKRFEYLRWPASWNQVTDNILELKETIPVNSMFLVEETISVMNILYQNELDTWVEENFSHNRLGDRNDHTKHLAHDTFSLDSSTHELVELLGNNNLQSFIPDSWQENPALVQKMVDEVKLFDKIRNQKFANTFPEVAECYARYF